MLDAAAGLLRPGGALRNRILLMAAILETTPEFADHFLPQHMGPLALVLHVGVAGTVAVLNALGGRGPPSPRGAARSLMAAPAPSS